MWTGKELYRIDRTMPDGTLRRPVEKTKGERQISDYWLWVPDDAPRVNPNGGAIARCHPLGASGARIALTAARQLQRSGGRYALVSLCIGGGQGMAAILERV